MGRSKSKMTWHLEILGPRQRRVLQQIGPTLSHRGFFLVDGTAVALQLGHRRSVDFDWFTRHRFDPLTLASELKDEGIDVSIKETSTNTLHGVVGGVQVSLIRHNYPLLAELGLLKKENHVASLDDLIPMKLAAIAQRGAKKDFIDIYALGKHGFTLRQMFELYRKKFAIEDIAHLTRSLNYFDDADRERVPKMLWDTNWRTVKKTIQSWLRDTNALD